MPRQRVEPASVSQMLNSFRVNELKKVLSEVGMSRQGRKQDLRARIDAHIKMLENTIARDTTQISLLRQMLEQINTSIEKTYYAMIASRGDVHPYAYGNHGISADIFASNAVHGATGSNSDHEPLRCICRTRYPNMGTMIQCDKCQNWLHTQCVGITVANTPMGEWYCCFCRFQEAGPFVETISTHMEPTLLSAARGDGRYEVFSFMLSFSDHEKMLTSGALQKKPGSYQIQLTCLDPLARKEDGTKWPINCFIRVNGHLVFEKMMYDSKKKGPDQAIIITEKLHIGANRIELSRSDARPFIFTAQMVRVLNEEVLLKTVQDTSESFTLEDAKAKVISSFNAGKGDDESDLEIVATSTILSLRCPLGLCKIKTPVRGRSCTHLQCFDLSTFLNYNRTNSNAGWKCPVCNKTVRLKDLIIDPYLAGILKETEAEDAVEEVEIKADASWDRRIKADKNGKQEGTDAGYESSGSDGDSHLSPSKRDFTVVSTSMFPPARTNSAPRAILFPNAAEVIDLIESDDEGPLIPLSQLISDGTGNPTGQNGGPASTLDPHLHSQPQSSALQTSSSTAGGDPQPLLTIPSIDTNGGADDLLTLDIPMSGHLTDIFAGPSSVHNGSELPPIGDANESNVDSAILAALINHP